MLGTCTYTKINHTSLIGKFVILVETAFFFFFFFFFFFSITVYAFYAWDTHLAGLIKVDPKNKKYSNYNILMTIKVT